MAELLTHVLVGYVLAVLLSWRYEWITYPFVVVAMFGALLPDLNRIELLLPAATIEATLQIPWSWTPLHRVGGTLVVIAIGVVLAPATCRRGVAALLALGAGSHYLLDFFLYKPSGLTGPFLWPFTSHRFAVEGFYLSSDRWTAAVMILIALVVWYADRRLNAAADKNPADTPPN